MAIEKIVYTISPKGKVDIEVEGVKGSGCMQLTDTVTAALGNVDELTKKPDYYEGGSGVFGGVSTDTGAKK